mmetsp:Transcript_23908/g.67178  ORF Transcript_23908/g.67178 Transcript_23908/m.67178 type:complete len:397 (-) Transcript_23908:271-1461(-)
MCAIRVRPGAEPAIFAVAQVVLSAAEDNIGGPPRPCRCAGLAGLLLVGGLHDGGAPGAPAFARGPAVDDRAAVPSGGHPVLRVVPELVEGQARPAGLPVAVDSVGDELLLVPDFPVHEGRDGECLPAEEEAQVGVHDKLLALTVDVVRVRAEGVLQLDSDEVQGPEGEDLDEGENHAPPELADPGGNHEGHREPVHEQDAVACLRVGERERDTRDLHRVAEVDHAPRDLLERPGEDRRGNAQHACLDIHHNQLLDPLEDQLDLAVRVTDAHQAVPVDCLGIDQLHIEGSNLGVVDAVAAILDLPEGCGVDHAEEPDERVLELQDELLVRRGVLAERHEGGAAVEPLRAHPVDVRAALPEAVVRLRCPEDNEEPNQEAESAPNRIVIHECVLVPKVR